LSRGRPFSWQTGCGERPPIQYDDGVSDALPLTDFKRRPTAISVKRASRRAWVCAIAAVAVALILTICACLTRGPWWDEGLFADVALNFRNYGSLRSSVLAPYSFDNLPGVDRHMYWQLPGYLVSLGIWFHIVPFSVEWMRLFSTLWAVVFVASWFFFVRALSTDESLALLIASVIALDYSVIAAASNGRMEMMCAALGQAALACYVVLRDSRIRWALFLAGLFGASSLFCHPMGIVTNSVLAVMLLLDRRKFRWNEVLIAIVPYVVFAVACGLYIWQDPTLFAEQAKAVSAYRVGSTAFLIRNLLNDFSQRYLQFYFAPLSGLHRLKIFSLLFGLCGAIGLLFSQRAGREQLRRFLLLAAAVAYLGVAAVDDLKYPHYFVYVTPLLAACGALWLYRAERRGARWFAIGLLIAYVGVNIGLAANWIYRNEMGSVFRPMARTVQDASSTGELVMGPSELGFALGFQKPLLDDCTLGFKSGVAPKVYVMYPACEVPGYSESVWTWARDKARREYHPIAKMGGYTVYLRNQ
jgi:hypothetical protein